MLKLNGMWVLEWSMEQECFHVQTVDEMIKSNMESLIYNRKTQYVPIYFCATISDAHAFSKKLSNMDCKSMSGMAEKWDRIWKGDFK